jgi:hypothetical protein
VILGVVNGDGRLGKIQVRGGCKYEINGCLGEKVKGWITAWCGGLIASQLNFNVSLA